MKKASKSSKTSEYRQKAGGSSYSTSGDDSHNNSIYQIRTNHHKKSIPCKNSLSIDSQPSIVWVIPDKPHYETFRVPGEAYIKSVPPNTRQGTTVTKTSIEKRSPTFSIGTDKSNPQEVRMVLQARGSPPVEVAAKIISKEETERAIKRSLSGSSRSVRDSTVSTKNTLRTKLRSSSVISSRVPDKVNSKNSDRISLASEESSDDPQWYAREQCGPPICIENSYDPAYCPEQQQQHHLHQQQSLNSCGNHYDIYYNNQQIPGARRRTRRMSCQQNWDQCYTQPDETREITQGSKSDVRVNKNCNDSKTCDCCMETPKKVSTIYLCEKHPRDSRTYCCKEVVDRDISPTPNVVYVSPSRISRRSGCECVHQETPTLKRRQSCSTCISQVSRPHSSTGKPSEDCRCVRKTSRNQCNSRCSDEISRFLASLFPRFLTLVCVVIKYLLVVLIYVLLMWLLRLYTALNHYAHLTLLSANLLMLFILIFQPDCLFLYLLGSS